MTTEQFYVNYEFSDEKVNGNGELTEDRIIELLDAFYEHKTSQKVFPCEKQGANLHSPCITQCDYCIMANDY